MANWNGLDDLLERLNLEAEEEDLSYDWLLGSRFGERPILVNRIFETLWHQNGVNR